MEKKIETEMPRELASLLGIVLRDKLPVIKPEPRPAALYEELKDGILTLTYNGDVMGWINDIKAKTPDGKRFRAVSVHGEVKHCYEIAGAKEFICSKYN
jgi:hypothetical protein